MSQSLLAGRRVLVAEDDAVVALLIEDLIKGAGGDIIGPFTTVSDTMKAVPAGGFDIALLDLHLRERAGYPIATLLEQLSVPFIILSGYGAASGPNDRPGWTWHQKPFKSDALLSQIQKLIHQQHFGKLESKSTEYYNKTFFRRHAAVRLVPCILIRWR